MDVVEKTKGLIHSLPKEDWKKLFPHKPLMIGFRGSISHGLYVPPTDPNSICDIDLMGVLIPPMEYFIGLKRFEGTESFVGELDIVTYNIQKFIRLLTKGNPNVIGMLWLRPEHYIQTSWGFDTLVLNRELFCTRNLIKSFLGYADGQLKRMTHLAYQGYMGEKRKQLVKKFGYDTKNAAHLIRLLKMCKEFIETGRVNVYRTEDRDQLLEIKSGQWSLAAVEKEAGKLFNECKSLEFKYAIPKYPDEDKISRLTEYIIKNEVL